MNPFHKKLIPFKIIALNLCVLSFFNCSNDSSSNTELNVKPASLIMQMNYIDTPLIDSLTLDCKGLDTLHYIIDKENPYLDLDLFPFDDWKFIAKLYANGALMQKGEVNAKLESGKNVNLTITMHALLGFVYIEIPLGLGNPSGIASGKMILENNDSTYIYPMQINNFLAIFKTGMLPLNKTYKIKVIMQNKDNEDIYESEETIELSESNPSPILHINSLRAKVNLGIDISKEVNLIINSQLPSTKKSPKTGDIFISEFMSSPLKTDSTQYEFIEIYNGTLDTILLEGCYLGTNSQESKGWPIISKSIAPNKIIVFGDTSANTPIEFRNTSTWGDLTNTKSSIVLTCNGTIIDSLFYSATSDTNQVNLIPNSSSTSKNPQSTHLMIEKWYDRKNPENWCISSPSPGHISNCQ